MPKASKKNVPLNWVSRIYKPIEFRKNEVKA